MHPFLWLAVILVSAGTAAVLIAPIRKKLTALESMCEMLSRAVRGDFGKK